MIFFPLLLRFIFKKHKKPRLAGEEEAAEEP